MSLCWALCFVLCNAECSLADCRYAERHRAAHSIQTDFFKDPNLNPGIGDDYLSGRRHRHRRDVLELALSGSPRSDIPEKLSGRIKN
jgi:hypothetical protein